MLLFGAADSAVKSSSRNSQHVADSHDESHLSQQVFCQAEGPTAGLAGRHLNSSNSPDLQIIGHRCRASAYDSENRT